MARPWQLLFLALALAAAPAGAAVQPSLAKAVTLRPLSIVKIRDLEFGNLLASPSPGRSRSMPTPTRAA